MTVCRFAKVFYRARLNINPPEADKSAVAKAMADKKCGVSLTADTFLMTG